MRFHCGQVSLVDDVFSELSQFQFLYCAFPEIQRKGETVAQGDGMKVATIFTSKSFIILKCYFPLPDFVES